MGTVYRARDVELDEVVALKVLRSDLIDIPGVVDRFRREVKLARRVTHRNVARVFDIGEHNGEKFLTMELIDGEPLAERIRRAPLSWTEALRVSLAIVEGLAAAHAAGVVHRDLKPENVLLTNDGRVVITDFGIARARIAEGDALQTSGAAVGTPAYMAPEQIEPDREVDARADVYAFGAVMFELFTGKRAWPGENPIAVAAARLLQSPPDPRAVRSDLPEVYAAIISCCMQRRPSDRFPSAEAVALALRVPSPWVFEEADGTAVLPYDVRTAPTQVQMPASLSGGTPVTEAPTGLLRPLSLPSADAETTAQPRSPRTSSTLASAGATMVTPSSTGPRPSVRSAPPPSSEAAPSSTKSVAVLPFRNAGNADDEYLADGLTDELIDTLSMTPGLRVKSRGVVMQHKGTESDPREVGAKLDVGLVVEGSIRRTSSGVRITARVVLVRDGSQLWAKRFDKHTVDVFEVSDEVARAVAEALTLNDASPPPRESPADPAAMDLYLRGRQEYRKYWPEAVRRSVTLFEQALERAPNNPTILSAYALACARLWWFGGPEGAQAGANARQAAERALAAAPHLGEPHFALAQVMWNSGDALAAVRSLQKALARAPTLAEAHALRGRVLVEGNRLEAGVKSLTTAMTLEPNVPLAVGELARAYAFLGKWDDLPALAERSAQTEGPQALWFMRARFALWQRDRVTAEKYLGLLKEGQRVLAVAKWLFEQVLTDKAPSEVIDLSFFVARDEASARRRSFIYQIETEVRAFHGQFEGALVSIEKSLEHGLFDLAWLERCPLLAPMRQGERFVQLRSQLEERVLPVMLEA
ncbi:MAG: protein kinase [Polyangiaceae bacterium]|nr:protein kinase [Polyangiaceae bacterium]